MQLSSSVHDTESVLTVSGSVDAADVPELRVRILDVIDQSPGDVLLDMRGVTPVDDRLVAALAAARSRAKHHRHRLAVIAGDDAPAATSLRRHGMHFRIPIYPDPASATGGLAGSG